MPTDFRYIAFGRVLPGAIYAFLAWRFWQTFSGSVSGFAAHPGARALLLGPVQTGFYFLFALIPATIYVVRPRPQGRDGSLPARLAAFLGTTILLGYGAYLQPSAQPLYHASALVADAAGLLLVSATIFGVIGLLYLRLSFSILPEARRLVRRGPYRLVRHPLYLAEIATAFAYVIPAPTFWSLVILPPFVCLQVVRTGYEERLLGRTFPEYAEYARHTARLIPFVW